MRQAPDLRTTDVPPVFRFVQGSAVKDVWRVLLGLTLGLFVLSIPARFEELRQLAVTLQRDPALSSVAPLIGPDVYPHLVLGLEIGFVVALSLVSAGIAWGHTGDPRALFFSAVFITYSVWVTPTLDALVATGLWTYVISVVQAIGLLFAIHFFLLFPDGRFVPSWTRKASIAWVIYTALWAIRPDAWFSLIDPFETSVAAFTALMAGWTTGMVAQAVRYRREADPAQRRQTKWVLITITAAILGYGAVYLAGVVVFVSGPAQAVYRALGVPSFWLLALPMPIAFFSAMVRYRLFDFGMVVNRTIVYASLTGALTLAYLLGVFVLQPALRPFTSGSTWAVAFSTLAVAGMFRPARDRMQRTIDRHFYRRRYDPESVLGAFTSRLRHETDLEEVTRQLGAVVNEVFQPAQVGVWVLARRDHGPAE